MHGVPRARVLGAGARSATRLAVLLTASGLHASDGSFDARALEQVAREELSRTRTPGIAVAVVQGDRIVYAKGFGVASVETGVPVTPDTLFFSASMGKMLTAAVVVPLLAERGISLDQPIGEYVQGFGPRLRRVTMRQLLSHSAGLVNSTPDGALDVYDEIERGREAERLLGYADGDYFFTDPGRLFSYSNTGFAIAGFVAQELEARPFWQLMEQRLFKPLAMTRATYRPTMAMTYPFAVGHRVDEEGRLQVSRPAFNEVTYRPAGLAYVSANDMSRFALALLNEGRLEGRQLLPADLAATLSRPTAEIPYRFDVAAELFEGARYGLGCFVKEHRGEPIFMHPGGDDVYGSILLLAPRRKFAVVVLANQTFAILSRIVERAMELSMPLLERPAAEPERTLPIPSAESARLAGTYANGALRIELRDAEGQLLRRDFYADEPEGPAEPVRKLGENRFRVTFPGNPAPTEFIFIPGPDGRPEYLFGDLVAARRAAGP